MPTVKEGFVQDIIGRYDGDPGMLIPMMQDLQSEYGYLPPEELKRLSKELGVPLTRVYGVAMFYASFRLAPKGLHEVTLCMGTVCYLRGAPKISEAICDEYGIKPGGTTSDRLFTLNAVNCLGCCAIAPVMVVDDKYHGNLTPEEALKILSALAQKEPEAKMEASASAETARSAEAPAPPAAATPAAPAEPVRAAKPAARSPAKKAEANKAKSRAKASPKGKAVPARKSPPRAASKPKGLKKGGGR